MLCIFLVIVFFFILIVLYKEFIGKVEGIDFVVEVWIVVLSVIV